MTKGMERKVGEVFNFKGEMLQVKDTGHDASCNGCYFNGVKLQVKDTDRETSCNGCYLNEYYRYWE